MPPFFTRERFGRPQFAAVFLLLLFLLQCLWLIALNPVPPSETARVQTGLAQWHQGHIEVGDPYRSPLYYLLSSLPLMGAQGADPAGSGAWRFRARVPWLMCGLLLGASLWYVARRLYGNSGGYIALVLYCFSPLMIAESSSYFVQPEVSAAWGTFGGVFTAVAVSHTLYAPRRVLWNWRRILLLGLSLALAIGSQFSLWIVLPLALGFMLYLAPGRRGAACAIFAAACAAAFAILWAAYSFSPGALAAGFAHARFWDITPQALGIGAGYREFFARLARASPVLLVFVPWALVTFFVWARARYFGNAAPLIVAAVLLVFSLLTPHQPGQGFELVAIPFLFVFVAGVLADLLESKYQQIVLGVVLGLLAAYIVWSVTALARVGRVPAA